MRCARRLAAPYAGEALAAAIGTKAGWFAQQVKKTQSVLGDHQDAVIAGQMEPELGISAHLAARTPCYSLPPGRDSRDAARLQAQHGRHETRLPRSLRRWMQQAGS
jgi:CHAD domain-containing protein